MGMNPDCEGNSDTLLFSLVRRTKFQLIRILPWKQKPQVTRYGFIIVVDMWYLSQI